VSASYPDEHQQTIWNTSVNVIGPVFLFFVWWTLQEAQRRGIKRLYFLARDGQVLLDIANLIKESGHFDIDCRYLYGSRQSWLTSSVKTVGKSELKWIMSDWWYPLSIDSVCRRMGFKPEELGNFFEHNGFPSDHYKELLNSDQKQRLIQCLQSVAFGELYLKYKQEDQSNMLGYLRQEGIFDNEAYGLVDIGWRGNQQLTLNKILKTEDALPKNGITGFYLGLTESVHKIESDTLLGFLFDLSSSSKRIYLRNNHIYEAFTAGLDGRVIKFRSADGKFYPAMAEVNQKLIEWGVGIQREGILKFAKEFMAHAPAASMAQENYYPVLEKIMYKFINTPSLSEAQVYGQFPMDGEMTESRVQEIAPVITRRQFWQSCINLKDFRLYWIQSVFIRSHLWVEYNLWKIILPVIAYSFYLMIKCLKLIGISPL